MAKRQQTQTEAQPIHDLADQAAELALLGCLILDTEFTLEACGGAGVNVDAFYFSEHARLFTVLMDAYAKGEPADYITLAFDAPELRGLAQTAQAAVPSFLHAQSYAQRVAELAERRRMTAIAEQLATAAVAGDLDKAAALLAGAEAPRTKRKQARTSYTLAELLAAEFPDPVWLVPGFIPVGLVVLAGRPKLGKSWMALQLAGAVASGSKFMNTETPRRPALYIALEDSAKRLRDRITRQRTPGAASINFEFDFPSLSDDRALLMLERLRAEHGYQLIVIDTLARALGRVDQNDQVAVGLVVGQLQRWAIQHDVCLLLVDHHKKPSATVNDLVSDVLGATSKTAVADAVIGLYRQRGQRDATLKITGRDVEERELSVELDKNTFNWVLRGDADQVAVGKAEQAVIEALQVFGDATYRELCDATGQDRGNAFKTLTELVNKGILERTEGRPARFALVKDVSVSFKAGQGG